MLSPLLKATLAKVLRQSLAHKSGQPACSRTLLQNLLGKNLQANGPLFQSAAFRVVGELRRECAVDKELKVIPAGHNADVVPLVRAEIRRRERSGDGA